MNSSKYEIGSFYEKENIIENWFKNNSDSKGKISALEWINKYDDIYFFESGRSAELAIIKELENKVTNKVCLIPSYICDTVIIPFEREGWSVFFYQLNDKLEPSAEELKNAIERYNPSVILTVQYYGFCWSCNKHAFNIS